MATDADALIKEQRLSAIIEHFAYDKDRYTPSSYANQLFIFNMRVYNTYRVGTKIMIDDFGDEDVEIVYYVQVKMETNLLSSLYDIIKQYPNNRLTLPTENMLRELNLNCCNLLNRYVDIKTYNGFIFQLIPVFIVRGNLLCYADLIDAAESNPLYSNRFVCISLDIPITLKKNTEAIQNIACKKINSIYTSVYDKKHNESDWIYPTDLENHVRPLEKILYYFKILKTQ